jgi:hypothetical protein
MCNGTGECSRNEHPHDAQQHIPNPRWPLATHPHNMPIRWQGGVIAVPKPALTPAVHEINSGGEGGFMSEGAANSSCASAPPPVNRQIASMSANDPKRT